MHYRYQISDGDEVTYTQWVEEKQGGQASRIDTVTRIRAAHPDARISIEKRQAKPDTDVAQ